MQKVNFTTTFGDQVSFDENGDALAIYDIVNWLWLPDGGTEVQTVGDVKRSAFGREELTIDEDKIFWNFELKQVLLLSDNFLNLDCRSSRWVMI